MGAAALIGLGLVLASQAGDAYATNEETKAQQGALNQEQGIQNQYNQKIANIDSQQMTKMQPGAQQQSLGGTAAGIAQAVGSGTANPTAAAAGAVAGSQGGSSSGQISQATGGAASQADLGASVLGALNAPRRQMTSNQQTINDWQVQRNRQKQFAQQQAANVFPWMMKAAAGKGASVAAGSALAGTVGAFLMAQKGRTSAAGTAGTGSSTIDTDSGLEDTTSESLGDD